MQHLTFRDSQSSRIHYLTDRESAGAAFQHTHLLRLVCRFRCVNAQGEPPLHPRLSGASPAVLRKLLAAVPPAVAVLHLAVTERELRAPGAGIGWVPTHRIVITNRPSCAMEQYGKLRRQGCRRCPPCFLFVRKQFSDMPRNLRDVSNGQVSGPLVFSYPAIRFV